MKINSYEPIYYCRIRKSKSGLYYGYYNGCIITEGCLTVWGCKRQIKRNFTRGSVININIKR